MSLSVSAPIIDKCAACGKVEDGDTKLKKCNACLSVKYCSRECQAAHRPQHKKACKKRAAELYDEKLFKEVEPDPEACPICMTAMPFEDNACCFKPCCGKMICTGCIYAMTVNEMGKGKRKYEDNICPFCRTPPCKSDKEEIRLLKKLLDTGNGGAYKQLADYYHRGVSGLSQDYRKSNELYLKGGELGCANSYFNLGTSYFSGHGVEVDKKMAIHYYELAAMGGDMQARHNLGCIEGRARNNDRAKKHWILAARAGMKESLDAIKEGFIRGFLTKDEYASTLRAYYDRQKEMKSDARDKASVVFFRRG